MNPSHARAACGESIERDGRPSGALRQGRATGASF